MLDLCVKPSCALALSGDILHVLLCVCVDAGGELVHCPSHWLPLL